MILKKWKIKAKIALRGEGGVRNVVLYAVVILVSQLIALVVESKNIIPPHLAAAPFILPVVALGKDLI